MNYPELDTSIFVCADCGASDPQWASINRGVLICSECCFVHRNLGRHISQMRSLKKGIWNANQLALIDVLYKNGSNNIWEHTLLDPQSSNKIRKKPTSNDPVIPKKEAYIKAKYVELAFAIRPNIDDLSLDDLNKQLWSCVRTSHVETALRLLALGADPNYADPDKGNTPLHIAAKENQGLQVELLWIYGADVAQQNLAGHTPSAIAKMEGHIALSERLVELEFEVTDRLTMFLCGRKPDHTKNQHFLIPELTGQATDIVKRYRKQLQHTSNILLEKLFQDVYDEVDRRETEAEWQASQPFHLGNYQHVAVFLPPNPNLPATRNQLRQKLAKYGAREFAMLLIDMLKEAKRRCMGLPLEAEKLEPPTQRLAETYLSGMSGENGPSTDPNSSRDYDEVADVLGQRKSNESFSFKRSSGNKSSASDEQDPILGNTVTLDDFLELKERVNETNGKLNSLMQLNTEMLKEFKLVQRTLSNLQEDQSELRRDLRTLQNDFSQTHHSITRRNPSPLTITSSATLPPSQAAPVVGAMIMPSSALLHRSAHSGDSTDAANLHSVRFARRHGSLTSPNGPTPGQTLSRGNSGPERFRNGSAPPMDTGSSSSGLSQSTQVMSSSGIMNKLFDSEVFPDNLILEIELLTGAIKSLLTDLQQEGEKANAVFHADSIHHHIGRILKVIPPSHRVGDVADCMKEINLSMASLSGRCLAKPLDVDTTCHAAYDLAKAAKELLVTVHRHQDI
uniref:Arf-GAP domain-containing protein n=1 Tax=Acrobeloides nanus TaxID=290746 RepID=A0A914DYF7_9BILA